MVDLRKVLASRNRQKSRGHHRYRRIGLEQLENRALLASLPAGFAEAAVATGLSNGTAMELAPNGDLWVLEQTGAVKRFRPGSTTADVVGNVSPLGLSASGERGLLGIAFDPQYATNKHVFLYYTATSPGTHNRISRFTVSDTDATDYYFAGTSTTPIDAGSSGTPTQTIIFELDALSSATNHNGGAIHFGPDGKLYVAVGENANGANAQTLANLHGKMLRINNDGTIPSDNPFFATATLDERAIWALGLRNPYTFAFQPGTGRMFINDVGQNTWEEINEGVAGSNYGWPGIEGNQGTPPSGPGVYRAPIYAYSHGGGPFQGFAITGGAFYNPAVQQFPAEYAGDYFFADFVSDWINVRDASTGAVQQFATGALGAVDLRVASDGSLYYLARGSNQVFRVTFPAQQAPTITQQPESQAVQAGATANFAVEATGTAPLRYQWQRLIGTTWTNLANGGRITGANSAALAISGTQAADAGQYRVVIANGAGMAISASATLTVIDTSAPQIIDNIDPGFSTVGPWISHPGQGLQDTVHYTAAGTGSAVARWSANVAPGYYEVAITWSPYINRATNAPFRVLDGSTALNTFPVNQELAPGDFFDQGVGWLKLGTFQITGNNLSIELTDNANEYVIADAVRLVRLAAPPPPSAVQIINDGSAGFSVNGPWIAHAGQGYQNMVHYAAAGTGDAVARWVANVTPGSYRVAVTWSPYFNRATNAPFRILDGGTVLGAFPVNQEFAPADFSDQGVDWESLGTFSVTGNSIMVELSNLANEYVIADAVRIERIEGQSPPEPEIINNGDAEFSLVGEWILHAGQGYGDTVHYAAAGTGSALARWTFDVTPGQYQVAVTWSPHSNRATNAPYRVLNGGASLGTFSINQELAPNDFTAHGVGWQLLGEFTITGSSLVVELSNNANEYVIADAVRILRVS
jgi:glucose/arabinose dehydrogenase